MKRAEELSDAVDNMVICPACGMEVSSEERECPRCGWEFEKTGKYDCPFCGELVSIKAQSCPSCGIDLSHLPASAKLQSVDKLRAVLLNDRSKSAQTGAEKRTKSFRCPRCAAPLDGAESACPECGQFLVSESGLRCPVCSTPIEKRRRKCHNCGLPIGSVRREAMKMIPYAPEPAAEPAVGPEEPSSTRKCPSCGAVVEGELLRCPACDADLAQEKAEPLAESLEIFQEPEVAEAVQPSLPEDIPETPEEQEPALEKVVRVDLGIREGRQGRTNGLSKVNGRGRTNGAGAVNGRSFVNGTGISNGLGPRDRKGAAAKHGLGNRWQFFAVLIVIALLVPTFIYLSNTSNNQEFAVDGKFGDWDQATVFGTLVSSTSPSSNITQWAVATQASSLYLYFKTQSNMMSSSQAESYYLFVDTDGSMDTGYIVKPIGAEYMLQLTGWDNSVNSSSLFRYDSSDQLNWSAWTYISSPSYSTDGLRLEARAGMPVSLGDASKFILLSKDSMERGSISYAAPLRGDVLVVEQVPSDGVATSGVVPVSNSVAMMKVRFTSEGGSGRVERFNSNVEGATLVTQIPSFSLSKGESKDVTISVDTSSAIAGQLVTVDVVDSSIESSYSSVVIVGSGSRAYVGLPPAGIAIDGAFADWAGRLSTDVDVIPVKNANVDIDEVGNVSTAQESYFYVSVEDGILNGSYVPALVARPSGSGGGGGVVISPRLTAEDVLRIFVDTDLSNSTGEWVSLDSKQIGADSLIEVKGLFGDITSAKEFRYSSGKWQETNDIVDAANDARRIEVGVTADSLGGAADIDYIVETTSWQGRGDTAMFDPGSLKALTRAWSVETPVPSPYATSMSYQRKMFYDEVNFWSFFFDGSDTVYKYSVDDGQTWNFGGHVFRTPGVNETSMWYDSSTNMVYAVGDTSMPSTDVLVQTGIVDASAHKIAWAFSDKILRTSLYPIAGKNTYISKDSDGYLWVLSSNFTQNKNPIWHDLSAYRSTAANDTSTWTNTGQILPYGNYEENAKGSIVPAGSGSDMWAIYAYAGYVAAKKYENGAWPADYDEQVIFAPRSSDVASNTDNSPPSVVVDSKGVVHVVYGTGRADKGKRSIPLIFYSHNNTDSVTFTAGLNLDPSNDTLNIANYYPTISLDSSTDSLYVLWLQSDSTFVAKTVMGRKYISGTWSDMIIEPQTGYAKQFLTSAYSVSSGLEICWQWTQNVTAPLEVLFDGTMIPEFSGLTVPVFCVSILVLLVRRRR